MKKTIGVAVLGLGWMGQAHSRSMLRIPSLFEDRKVNPRLVVCADTDAGRRTRAVEDFGFERSVEDWREAVTAEDRALTPDLGGQSGTREFTDAVLEKMSAP